MYKYWIIYISYEAVAFSISLSPPVSIKRGVQYIEQYIPARLALQNNTNLVFAKTFGVFSISKSDVFTLNMA